MTLTETQQAILTQAACRSDGLAVAPAHLPPGPRAEMAKALLAAGLVIRVEGTDAEPDAGWKLDGQVTFLRIANASRQAIGADEPPVDGTASRPESRGVSAAGAGGTVDAAATASEAAKPPVTRSGSRPLKLREAAAALLARWDETTAREPLADRIANQRAALSPARPTGSPRGPRQGTKQQAVLALLRRQEGSAMPIPLSADYDAASLRSAARESKDAGQTRRLLTLAAIYDRATRTEAAAIGGVTVQIVRDWVLKLTAHGPTLQAGSHSSEITSGGPLLDASASASSNRAGRSARPLMITVGTARASLTRSSPFLISARTFSVNVGGSSRPIDCGG